MGGNYSQVQTLVDQSLSLQSSQSSSGSALASCENSEIEIQVIESDLEGCVINFENRCYATTSITQTSIIEAYTDAISKVASEQSADFLSFASANGQITSESIRSKLQTLVEENCSSAASVHLMNHNIRINIVGTKIQCTPGEPLFSFINWGNAEANCAQSTIAQTMIKSKQEVENTQSTGIDLSGYLLWIGLIILGVIAIIIAFLFIIPKLIPKAKFSQTPSPLVLAAPAQPVSER